VTETPSYTIQLSGGPQDGNLHTFDFLPLLIGGEDPPGGVYSKTEEVAEDGAVIFDYTSKDDQRPLTDEEEADIEEMMKAMYGGSAGS
jgi:hypothetical protein